MQLSELISSDIGVKEEFITNAVNKSFIHVKRFHIKKRNGGDRLICQPAKQLKTIQHWLINNVFSELPISTYAMAYRKRTSILDNAKEHKDNKYFIKTDLQDFFPSVKSNDLLRIIKIWHAASDAIWLYNQNAIDLIKKSCFSKDGSLPIGYPASPIISNIVMHDFDTSLMALLNDHSQVIGEVKYTRYADDMVFSTNTPNVCHLILEKVERHINESVSPRITINSSKTKFGSSSSGSALVTGLRICSNGHLTIHRKHKDHIRLLLSLYKKNALRTEDYSSLRGHLSYIQSSDPKFYTKIQSKYFEEIRQLRSLEA